MGIEIQYRPDQRIVGLAAAMAGAGQAAREQSAQGMQYRMHRDRMRSQQQELALRLSSQANAQQQQMQHQAAMQQAQFADRAAVQAQQTQDRMALAEHQQELAQQKVEYEHTFQQKAKMQKLRSELAGIDQLDYLRPEQREALKRQKQEEYLRIEGNPLGEQRITPDEELKQNIATWNGQPFLKTKNGWEPIKSDGGSGAMDAQFKQYEAISKRVQARLPKDASSGDRAAAQYDEEVMAGLRPRNHDFERVDRSREKLQRQLEQQRRMYEMAAKVEKPDPLYGKEGQLLNGDSIQRYEKALVERRNRMLELGEKVADHEVEMTNLLRAQQRAASAPGQAGPPQPGSPGPPPPEQPAQQAPPEPMPPGTVPDEMGQPISPHQPSPQEVVSNAQQAGSPAAFADEMRRLGRVLEAEEAGHLASNLRPEEMGQVLQSIVSQGYLVDKGALAKLRKVMPEDLMGPLEAHQLAMRLPVLPKNVQRTIKQHGENLMTPMREAWKRALKKAGGDLKKAQGDPAYQKMLKGARAGMDKILELAEMK